MEQAPPVPASLEQASAEQAVVENEPIYLEALSPGDQWTSPAREITGDDVAEFAVLTGDDDPLHTDPTAPSPFGRPIAHGLLGLSIMAGLSSNCPRTATLALVEVSQWEFQQPIFFGDRVRTRATIESITPHGRRAGRVVWVRELINQNDRVVQRGRIVTLVARRHRHAARPKLDGEARKALPPR